MDIFLTGGTGFVGRHLLKKLLDEEHTVKCLVREKSKSNLPEDSKVVPVPGSIHEPVSFEDALDGCDAAINLVGIISELRENTFYRIHTLGTVNVVEAMRQHGVKRLIQMSALGTRPGARSRYHITKHDAEEHIRMRSMDYTIFRPSVIHGPDGEFMELMKKFAKYPFFPVPGKGESLLQPVYVEDVADVIVKSLTTPASIGRDYNLGGPVTYRFEEIVKLTGNALDTTARAIHLPLWYMNIIAMSMEVVCPLVGKKPELNTDQLLMTQEDNTCDSSEAEETFGTTFAHFEEALATYVSQIK